MSDDSPAYEAYRPPEEAPRSPGGSAGGRPGGLTAICVIAIVLGALGLFSALVGVAGLAIGGRMQQMFSAPPPGDSDAAELHDRVQREMQEVAEKYRPYQMAALAGQVAVAGCLLAGGVGTLVGRAGGRTLLSGVCRAAIVFELCRGVLQTMVQLEMTSLMKGYFQQMIDAGVEGQPGADVFLPILQAAMYAGFVFGAGLIVAKVIYYVLAIRYLRKPAVRSLFERISPAAEIV